MPKEEAFQNARRSSASFGLSRASSESAYSIRRARDTLNSPDVVGQTRGSHNRMKRGATSSLFGVPSALPRRMGYEIENRMIGMCALHASALRRYEESLRQRTFDDIARPLGSHSVCGNVSPALMNVGARRKLPTFRTNQRSG